MAREKYWYPAALESDRKNLTKLKMTVNASRAKVGKPKYSTQGEFISALIKLGNTNKEELVNL